MKEVIIAILLLVGALFILIASIGLNRFRDTLSRVHATTKATSFGLLLILIATAIYFFSLVTLIKVILVVWFIYLTAPLAAHSISRSVRKNDQDE